MKRLVLGVIGHVDHGKTALVRALTGMETDRLAEEKARGISIALGFAHVTIGPASVDLIDMPGHERFVRTMVSGATGIDAVLLVVDAGEGIMPQTSEHIDIAALLGITRAIVAVSRTDRAEAAQIDHTTKAAASLAAEAGLHAPTPLACSALTGAGLSALSQAIREEIELATPAADDGAPVLPIDRAFSIAGHGTVVTGTLRGGSLSVGGVVEVAPAGLQARVRALEVHGSRVGTAHPGQRVAVNLRGVEPAQVPRGTCLSDPGSLAASAWLSVAVRAVPNAPPVHTGATLHLLFGTEEVEARLRLLDRDELAPGASAYAQLRCARPVSAPARGRFVLRTVSPPRTIAGGAILDPHTVRARRHAPCVLDRLAALAGATPAGIITGEVERAGSAGSTLTHLSRLAALGAAQTGAVLAGTQAITTRTGHVIAAGAFALLLTDLLRAVAAHPEGLPANALTTLMPSIPAAVLDKAASHLLATAKLAREGAILRVPRPAEDAERIRRTAAHAARIAAAIKSAGLSPPDAQAVAPDLASRRLLDGLVRAGIVIRAPDRVQKRDILFHRDAIDDARRALTTLLAERPMLVSEIGAALGISRKYSVPLLEHLDSVHFTTRVAERRTLATRSSAGHCL